MAATEQAKAAPLNWWGLLVEAEADDKDDTPEKRLARLYLTPRDEAVPDEDLGDDIHDDIYDLFYWPLSVIRDKVNPKLMITIEPSYDDTTYLQLAHVEVGLTHWKTWIKAWNFTFDNEAEFNKWAQSVADSLKPKPLYVLVDVVEYVTESARVFTDKVKAVEAAEEGSEPYWGKDNVEHDATDRIYWNQIRDDDASNHTAVFEVTPEV
jgi:hypothetical protein